MQRSPVMEKVCEFRNFYGAPLLDFKE